MSVHRNSLYNPTLWKTWGGPIAFGGSGVEQEKGILLGGSAETQFRFSLRLLGVAIGGVLSLLGLLRDSYISRHSSSSSLIREY